MPNMPLNMLLIGGPTVLIEYCGLRFLTDPTFDAGGGEYPSGNIMLTKTGSPAIGTEALGPLDAVLLSHDQHHDNLDASGRALLAQVPVVYTTPVGAGRLGGNAQGVASWQTVEMAAPLGGCVRITASPCRHGPAGIEAITGEVTGFVLESDVPGTPSLYVTGDTVFYEGVAEVARRFRPDFILAFAGSARPRGPFDVTMSANDVLDTAAAFPQARIIPIHTEGWQHYTQTADELAAVFVTLNRAERIQVIRAGQWTNLLAPPQ